MALVLQPRQNKSVLRCQESIDMKIEWLQKGDVAVSLKRRHLLKVRPSRGFTGLLNMRLDNEIKTKQSYCLVVTRADRN